MLLTDEKPLHHIYLEGFRLHILANHTLDENGHCCAGANGAAQPAVQGQDGWTVGVSVTNVAYGHVRDVEVSGALAQNIGLANTAGFDIVYVQQPLPLTARSSDADGCCRQPLYQHFLRRN